MAGFLKKFMKKKKTLDLHPVVKDRTPSSIPIKEVHHGFVDSVGGLNFPISPAKNKPFQRTRSDPSEFTILWSRPSLERKGTKMNPVFVEEPADFYEDVYIPPDNAHDFSVLPRYRVNEAYGNEGKDSLFRSRSIGAIPSFVNENHGMKLADVKKRRKDLASTSEGRLFGLFDNNNQSPSFSSPDNSRDSGVYQESDESMEESQVRKMVSSDSGTASAEDLVEQTFEDSNCMKFSSEHTEPYDLSHSEGGLERRFSKRSLDNSFGGRVFYVSQTLLPSDPTAKVILNEDVAHRYARSQSNNVSETRFHDGSLSRSMPHINTVSQRDSCNSDPDADLHSVEQRPNTVKSRLDVFLKRNSQEDTQLIENNRYSKNVLDSPDLAAMLKGRVLSVKCSLEGEQHKSKSMSNLTSTMDYEDSSDEEFFEKKRMTSAASFGHINVNSLSPLLNDRKFFSKMIVSKESHKNSNQQARKGSSSGQRRKKANATSSEESKGSIERRNGPVGGETSSLERPSDVLLEQQSSSLEQQSHRLEGQSSPPERHSAFEQQNGSPERRNSSLERHRNTSEEQGSGLEQLNPPERRTKTDILSNSDGTFRTLRRSVGDNDDDEKPNIVKARIGVVSVPKFTLSDLNIQQGKGTTSPGYLHSEGTFNTFTGAGVSILDTNYEIQDTHIIRKKPSVESFLRDMNRSELPHVVEDDDVYPDRACKRTIMQLMVRCYNHGSDCEWTGELNNLKDHLEMCEQVPVTCVNTCGRTDIPRHQMNQHIEADGDCPLAVILCRYSDVGCKFKSRRVDMEVHLHEAMEQHLDLAHSKIRELEVRQENICMNGKFLWKISNYDHLVKQSATKKDKEKLCSPPFYTGQYGYKLRAEAFLNGLGQGKGSHLSLYVVIMKGEYDAILPWPFKQNVDFVLIDQDDEKANRQNKVWKLSCERNSDYFQRPNKAKSLGFGCPKFVSLETLKTRNYIRDQTLFIKIEVEPTDQLIFAPAASH